MNHIEIRIIDREHKADINIPNEPFALFGRLIPTYDGEKWSYTTEIFPEKSEMCFPDENYVFEEMADCVFIGAYECEKCVGLAIMQDYWTKHMYLYDLKVNASVRGQHVGRKLMEKAREVALERGYRGIYTIGQDNNLTACLFYLANGFHIGGLDCDVYRGTNQEGKRDILFYTD
ncbi:MAG: GNAT family N-acetyltransferase [Oscillospiraceae bacterium]|nr:GNAT family N-acetyltransferase [Oscillospiraceae bacterium]